MSADIEFERRLRSELRTALDRVEGPHPDWAPSPAAAIVAADPGRRSRGVPWRLLAVAAVLVVGSVAAVILASRDTRDGVAGCPTLADYAAASAQPSPVTGKAPGVTFPPVAPTATMTTDLLQPGDWAVIANADGPGLQLRVRDIRDCGRLPSDRSAYPGGSLYLVTVDARVLRDDSGLTWLGVRPLVGLAIGESQGGTLVLGRDVPGVHTQSLLQVPEGFAATSTVILDLPVTDKRVTLDHPTENTQTLPGLIPTELGWPRVSWVVRDGDPTGTISREPLHEAAPGATPTSGEVRLGDDVTIVTLEGKGVLRLSEVDTVAAYPGLAPAPGNVFVEVLATRRDGGVLVSSRGWSAVGADGKALTIIQDAYQADPRPGVIGSLLREEGGDDVWIVVEAPDSGPVRLEYREYGNAHATFWVRLRD